MTRCKTSLLVQSILMVCSLAGAQTGQVSANANPARTATGNSPQASPDVQFQQRDRRYRLQKSDVVEVKFKFSPEYDQTLTVQPDGFITLDGASDIKVEGKTIPEVTEAVRYAYQGTLHQPVITVLLKDFEKPFFIAAGQVGHPGKYELRSNTTLIAALAMAGDITPAAKHSQVVLFRHVSSDTVEATVFNVKQMLGSHNLAEDPHLLSGDLVFVPQNKISKIQRFLPSTSMGTYVSPAQF